MIRQPWEAMAEVRLRSKRFGGDNAQELAWREFEQLARSIAEAAAGLWFAENPDPQAPLSAFHESTGAESVHAQAGEADAVIALSAASLSQHSFRPKADEIRQTYARIWTTLQRTADRTSSEGLPTILPFITWGLLLQEDDEVEIAPAGKPPVRLSTREFRRLYSLVLSSSRPILRPAGDGPRETVSGTSSLDQVLDDIAAQVPQEALSRIPTDFSRNMDHYLYGTPSK